ncbi:MAG: hypothetical protein IJ658_09315 [Kiritimatiellae bacterium]|nr:hypothetical protein [Kiritimatiellia bacterium]
MNLSRIPMSRVRAAATVVSDITERLSPNMAPPTTAPARIPGVNGGSPTRPAAIGISAAIVPQLVPSASESRHATVNIPASMKRAGMRARAIATAASTAPDALATVANAPANTNMRHISIRFGSPMPRVNESILRASGRPRSIAIAAAPATENATAMGTTSKDPAAAESPA